MPRKYAKAREAENSSFHRNNTNHKSIEKSQKR